MPECELCGTEDEQVELTTTSISYQYGPIMHELCRNCQEDPETEMSSRPRPIAMIREM